MAYIGRDPAYGNLVKQTLTPNSVTTNFALDYPVATAASILVSVGGVVQQPDSAYSILNSSTLVFSEAPTTGLETFIIYLGRTSELNTVVDNVITDAKLVVNAVTTSKIADSSVTTSKIADGNVTLAKIADSAISTSKILNANVTSIKMSNTGVTAATYGGSSNIASITVDSAGRITSASNITVTSGITTGKAIAMAIVFGG